MSLTVRFLGTSASRPTVERNVTALAIVREGETLLFDCGEGTQRQMMRYGVAFGLQDIFFTHWHHDHTLGVAGLMRTMALQGRTELLRLWGPKGAERALRRTLGFGTERLGYEVSITEVSDGAPIDRGDYSILPFAAEHAAADALGYAIVEEERRGRFNPDRARELGVPEGPMWGELHRGRAVTLPDGRVVEPSTIVGEPRPGRRVVLTGDTCPSESTVEVARAADLLIHEATFAEEEAARAAETGHSTARQAALVAERAGVRRLVLTHFSARYSRDASDLEREARAVFPETIAARDGMELEVPYLPGPITLGDPLAAGSPPSPRSAEGR